MFYLMKAGKIFSKNTFRDPAVLFRLLLIIFPACALSKDDAPCAKRPIEGQSVVCVCNNTYCDRFTSDTPDVGSYNTYTSSEDGKRFDKSVGSLQKCADNNDMTIILDVTTKYQSIVGFGGAVTDSAGINWLSLSSQTQKALINSYFSGSGLKYNMLRLPIGGTDFSTHEYEYNSYPENDTYLQNFALTYEDYHYKIPMINAAYKAAHSKINIVSSTWTPPRWMKVADPNTTGASYLLPEYYETYALYHRKFLEQYKENGIDIWAITTGNEPMMGVNGIATRSMGWNPTFFANWICDCLKPTLQSSSVIQPLILANDDQRSYIEHWIYGMANARPNVIDCLDGIAVHWYSDIKTSPDILRRVTTDYPQLPILYTEASIGIIEDDPDEKVILGSWPRAESYASDIIQNLNYNSIGWIDWNLCLNPQGGPSYLQNFLDSPVLVYEDKDEFIKQPMFYAIGQFSKFLPRGSQRVGQTIQNEYQNVSTVSFLIPTDEQYGDGQQLMVTVILNEDNSNKDIVINAGDEQCVALNVDANSITTIQINKNSH